ncbi:MAG: aminotransferase class V-fold PLP-dependent enzyme [Fuerstiella sp.]|nr:aminotransferase class V-fold PLP-dependent enzyme [Fuerstiella sp.]MCP4858296.1 aminotransferase class V-fold PLP-dependent enzyme [Fuerstiella sp.]
MTDNTIYLDNAATSFPKPDCVYAAADKYMREMGIAFGRGSHAGASDAARLVAQCRQRLAMILDAESGDRIAFTFNCTDGLNLLLRGVLRKGDRVVTSTLEHNSVLRPLQQLKSEFQLDVVHVDFDPGTGLLDTNSFVHELNSQPARLAVLNHASNVTGIVQPVEMISAAAHETGALLMLDAAQTVGHIPFSVRDLKIDMLATAGHKGLLGPLGTGIVYIRDGLEDEVLPIRCGGTGTDSESPLQPLRMPTKFESGNLNMPGLAGLNAAAEWILQQSVADLHRRIHELSTQLAQALRGIRGVTVFGGVDAQNVGIVSFSLDGMDSQDVAAVLDQSFQIRCRAGLHCAPLVHKTLGTMPAGGAVRLSPGSFTVKADVTAAAEAVTRLAASL